MKKLLLVLLLSTNCYLQGDAQLIFVNNIKDPTTGTPYGASVTINRNVWRSGPFSDEIKEQSDILSGEKHSFKPFALKKTWQLGAFCYQYLYNFEIVSQNTRYPNDKQNNKQIIQEINNILCKENPDSTVRQIVVNITGEFSGRKLMNLKVDIDK